MLHSLDGINRGHEVVGRVVEFLPLVLIVQQLLPVALLSMRVRIGTSFRVTRRISFTPGDSISSLKNGSKSFRASGQCRQCHAPALFHLPREEDLLTGIKKTTTKAFGVVPEGIVSTGSQLACELDRLIKKALLICRWFVANIREPILNRPFDDRRTEFANNDSQQSFCLLIAGSVSIGTDRHEINRGYHTLPQSRKQDVPDRSISILPGKRGSPQREVKVEVIPSLVPVDGLVSPNSLTNPLGDLCDGIVTGRNHWFAFGFPVHFEDISGRDIFKRENHWRRGKRSRINWPSAIECLNSDRWY